MRGRVMGFAVLISLVAGLAALIVMALIVVVRAHPRCRFSESMWREDGPPGEEALVPVGLPRRPLSEAAVALPLPDPEPEMLEAYGRDAGPAESGPESLAS
jgi:hypothetical protein